jgi:hypothetical protein
MPRVRQVTWMRVSAAGDGVAAAGDGVAGPYERIAIDGDGPAFGGAVASL